MTEAVDPAAILVPTWQPVAEYSAMERCLARLVDATKRSIDDTEPAELAVNAKARAVPLGSVTDAG